ncbi:Gaa1-domain-containing protein [Gymnopus androsaceus JB14]|uniref:Gaa1-domain-containing protein n=1 Tax=Gymnopus androsaceus JB14 TaxID=1447944 RepID=A0A6A4IG02_9AGAR|nr:Gaa1-domain-containing protein [Gymnopus androsaceus JB14]
MNNRWRPLNFLRPAGDPNLARIKRRKALLSLIARRVSILKVALFIAGYVWMLAIPSSQLDRGVFIDENALQPGQVNTYWNWQQVHDADHFLSQLEFLRDSNATSEQRSQFIMNQFVKIGLSASTQDYEFTGVHKGVNGTNAYAMLSSPRVSGAEAMVISASWLSRTNEGDGTLNLRGVATVLAFSKFVKQYSLWARDLIFVISDGYMDGMQAWLSAYHGETQSNLRAQRLDLTSGVIFTAFNIDYPGHSLSHLGIFHEGVNGRLPNQDLINSFQHIARRTGVPVVLYDHKDEPEQLSWLPEAIRNHHEIKTYAAQARNLWRNVGYQASGRGSGVHGLFHKYRIDAFTMFALPATGPHGFYSLGRIIESTLRTTNNLLERLHASFFFYVMTNFDRFLKIGNYLPSAILISVAMMFGGLQVWVDAAWTKRQSEESKGPEPALMIWARRRRPVLQALFIMIGTHFFGAVTFFLLSSRWYNSISIGPLLLFPVTSLLPLVVPSFIPQNRSDSVAPLSLVLKAFNLCLSSTVISIITVLNFSLAACLAVALGIPLSADSLSSNKAVQMVKYSAYLGLGIGWILWGDMTKRMLWNWDVLGVWLLPFLCVVYFPLTLQAALVCII